MGVEGLLLDVDGTLCDDGATSVDPAEGEWLRGRLSEGFRAVLVSNTRNTTRIAGIASEFDIPYIAAAGKPSPRAFGAALEVLGLRPTQALAIGDQAYTEGLAARRAGVPFVLVAAAGKSCSARARLASPVLHSLMGIHRWPMLES